MKRRIGVGLLVAAIGLVCVGAPWLFALLIGAIGLASLYELNQLCTIKGQPLEYPVAMLAVVAYAAMAYFGELHRWEGVLLAGIIIAAFWIGMYGEQMGYFARTAYTLLAVLYIGKLLTYFIFIRQIPGTGIWLTYYAILAIAFSDIFAMAIGSSIGRTPLTRISPKKTVEGSLGALLVVVAFTTLAAIGVPQLHLLWWQGAALGLGTGIAAQAGDLAESALKRDAGVKDAGEMIVGHGGVLDRFDSYLFGGVAFWAILHVVGVLGVQ